MAPGLWTEHPVGSGQTKILKSCRIQCAWSSLMPNIRFHNKVGPQREPRRKGDEGRNILLFKFQTSGFTKRDEEFVWRNLQAVLPVKHYSNNGQHSRLGWKLWHKCESWQTRGVHQQWARSFGEIKGRVDWVFWKHPKGTGLRNWTARPDINRVYQ